MLIGASAFLALFPAGLPTFSLSLPMVGRVARNLAALARQEPQVTTARSGSASRP